MVIVRLSSAYLPRVIACYQRLVSLPDVIVHAVEQRRAQVGVQIDEDDNGESMHIALLIVMSTCSHSRTANA